MGACDFITSAAGADAQVAFDAAWQEAKFEHGRGGYTGTIAEKGSFTIVDRQVRTLRGAREYADSLLRAEPMDQRISDKWGPAGAVPYCAVPEGGSSSRTVEFTCRVTGADVRGAHGSPVDPWVAQSAAQRQAEAKCRAGEFVSRVEVGRNPVAVKTRKEDYATKGSKSTVYRVQFTNPTIATTDYPTMAQARAALRERLAMCEATSTPVTGEVVALVMRDGGESLAIGSVTVPHADWKVTATIVKETLPERAQPTGWVFFGMASS